LKIQQVMERLGISRSGVYHKQQTDPDFPKGFKIAARQARWRESDLEAFINLKAAQALH
jgi:predicted DNA-binding transcriptional regulator AlpA